MRGQSFTHTSLSQISDTRGITIGNLDNNSFPDLFFSNLNNDNNEFYLNWKDTLIKIISGLGNINDRTNSSTIGDYDNDCQPDIFLSNGGGGAFGSLANNNMQKNAPYANFSSISNSLTSSALHTTSAAWGDFDNDGDLDIYITNFNSQNNQLFQNDGNGVFNSVTGQSLVQNGNNSTSCSWMDYDNDDDLDLFVVNAANSNNELYRQDSSGYFTRILTGSVTNDGGSSFSDSWGDYNNDGFLDLFIANSVNGVNFLYENLGNGSFLKVASINVVTENSYSTSSAWADLNNDGYLDLIVGNGRTLPGNVNRNFVYINNGNETFTKLNNDPIVDHLHSTTAIATSDLNRDGAIDVVMASRNQKNDIYYNQGNSNNFFSCELLGTSSNKMAYGAKVKIKVDLNNNGNPSWQYRELMSNSGGDAQSGTDIHFGLKSATTVDSLLIKWPSGLQCVFTNLPVNGFFRIKEGVCTIDTIIAANYNVTSHLLNATFTNTSTGPITSYLWDFGNGDSSSIPDPNYKYNQPGTYKVCLTIYDDYCRWDSICKIIEICPDTNQLGFTHSAIGRNLNFTDTSIANAFGFYWDFGDGTTDTGKSVNHIYTASGYYNVCLTVEDSCRSKSICKNIQVCNDTILANFGSSATGYVADFSDSSVNATSWSWDFGDGSPVSNSQNPSHIYTNPGVYYVCLTISDACTNNTYCDSIEICLDSLIAGFSFTSNGNIFNFNQNISNASSYLWDFGDGNLSVLPNPNHLFQTYGDYLVCLTVSNDCSTDSVCQWISVCPYNVQADFTYQSVVTQTNIQFTDNSTDAVSHYWDFDDGTFSTLKNPVKFFSTAGVYDVCLTATDSCGNTDTTCKFVSVFIGLDEYEIDAEYNIYPNPVKSMVTVSMPKSITTSTSLELTTVSGKKVITRNFKERVDLDLSHLPPGIYILKLITEGRFFTQKLVKD